MTETKDAKGTKTKTPQRKPARTASKKLSRLIEASNTKSFVLPDKLAGNLNKPIFTTRNYDQFSFFEYNREINRAAVDKIKWSIKHKCDHTASVPIVVTPEGKIADGQHRFIACRELGLPIHFTIVEGFEPDHLSALQIGTGGWKSKDYLGFHAERGREAYLFLEELIRQFNISLSLLIVMCAHYLGSCTGKKWRKEIFNEGAVEFDGKDKANLLEWCRKISEIQDVLADVKVTTGTTFFMAWLHLQRMDEVVAQDDYLSAVEVSYNHEQFLEQLGKPHCREFLEDMRGLSGTDVLRELLRIYDFKLQSDSKKVHDRVKDLLISTF